MTTTEAGFTVAVHPARPSADPAAIEIDLGSSPVAFGGARRLLRALERHAPASIAAARATRIPEWNCLFPNAAIPGLDLFEIADAPNQRRLFRESEQTYRVLNMVAHVLVEATRTIERPLVLRNAGTCDLVSLRGLMHAVELSRLASVAGKLVLGDWRASPAVPGFHATRVAHMRSIHHRMHATGDVGLVAEPLVTTYVDDRETLEGRYLARVLDREGTPEDRIAAAMLAIRACFFSTNYEGATLAIDLALELLERSAPSPAAMQRAWDGLDDPQFEIPMLELEREDLADVRTLRAQLLLHRGVICAFTARGEAALDAFARGLDDEGLAPECAADLHMYRAAALTKRMGKVGEARRDIEAGLHLLVGRPREIASLHAAWLHNLYALTHVQTKDLPAARVREELALACVDDIPGPSATHLKTNLISNFSVLSEAERDFPRAIEIWRMFEPLNKSLHSANADKVHAFRLATLLFLAGDSAAALRSFEVSFANAQATGDTFNGEGIAAAIARIKLACADLEGAACWYQQALELARSAGDCIQTARDLAGLELATGRSDFTAARACLGFDTTYDTTRMPLALALGADDPHAVLAALPLPRSKLTRPFDLVNVQ
jgi:tetratricopeptide (TPR) repeat protein